MRGFGIRNYIGILIRLTRKYFRKIDYVLLRNCDLGLMTLSKFPRILFITSHAFNDVTGGGITYSRLFSGWPKQALATIHNDPEPTSDAVCEQYFQLGPEEIDLVFPFNHLRRWYHSKRQNSVGEASSLRTSNYVVHRQRTIIEQAKTTAVWFLGEGLPERACLSDRLRRWIDAFQPQLIYTILGTNGIMALIEAVRCEYKLPIIVHLMDDWMSINHRHGLFGLWQRRRMNRLVWDHVTQAKLCLGISQSMCDAFEKRYGRDFIAFHNNVDVECWQPAHPKMGIPDIKNKPADILYVGSIFANAQLSALQICCQAVAKLNNNGFPARLTISSPSNHALRWRDQLKIDPAIEIVEAIRDDESFFARISAADLLLLPVNFDAISIRMIRYSMPTKLPAYLTVGTPILAFGPVETAQISYAVAAGWGLVVDTPDESALMAGLQRVLTDAPLRHKLSVTARKVARQNHDLNFVRPRFQSLLMQCLD